MGRRFRAGAKSRPVAARRSQPDIRRMHYVPAASGRTALVVAHPDDEALWLSSVVADVDHVVFCFGDTFEKPKVSAGRRAAIAALPLNGVIHLALPESGVRLKADRIRPEPTSTGVRITDPAAHERYTSNYSRLLAGLRRALRGVVTVYSHNPWGEYGHPEHIQVYRAVETLQEEFGYALCFTNYIGPGSWQLARALGSHTHWNERKIVKPDERIARQLMRVYRRHGAWTWNLTHRWPQFETLYVRHPASSVHPRHSMENEWLLDIRGLRWWPPPMARRHRRLRQVG